MKNFLQKYRFLLVLLLVLTISGCNYRNNIGIANDKREIVLSTWLTYWDMDSGVEELSKFGNKMKKVSYFAAYFDTNEKLFIPEELKNQIKSEKEKKVPKINNFRNFYIFCEPAGARTQDPILKRDVLYLLSY